VATPSHEPADLAPVSCARCFVDLQPGGGSFYRVTIEAVADPTPPAATAEDLADDLRQQIERTLAQLEDVSAQEAMDQVYRRLVLFLCVSCFRRWIEDPTG
jgi:hypothetical protein